MEPYWTDARVLEASESKLYHPDDAVVKEDQRRLLVHMPAHYGHSVVQWSRVSGEQRARELIEEVLAETVGERAQLSDQRLLWWVRPSTRPANMGAVLGRRGFTVVEEAEILAFDLVSAEGTERDPSASRYGHRHKWRIIRSLDEMRLAHEMRVRALGTGGPQVFEEAEAAADLRALERLEKEHPVDWRGPAPDSLREDQEVSMEFMAYEGSEPVATAGVTLRGAVAILWGAATAKEYRRRGAYRLLLGARCATARRVGATLALVKARQGTSGPLLRAAGFRRVGSQTCYALSLR